MNLEFERLLDSMSALLREDSRPASELERTRNFSIQTDLHKVEDLVDNTVSAGSELAHSLLQRLAPYCEGGFLLEKRPTPTIWHVTAIIAAGEYLALEKKDQVESSHLLAPLAPDEVRRASAQSLFTQLSLPFPELPPETEAFLFAPDPFVAYVLFCDLPGPWRETHVRHLLRLINRAFNP